MLTYIIQNIITTECCAGGYTGIYIDLSGEPLNYQFGLVGDYIMQDDLVNGRNYWIKDNGRYGIWFAEKNGVPYAWMVGSIGNLGTTTGGLASACTEDCGFCCQEWQYSNYAGQWQISSDIVLMVDGVCSAMCEI